MLWSLLMDFCQPWCPLSWMVSAEMLFCNTMVFIRINVQHKYEAFLTKKKFRVRNTYFILML